MCPRLKPKHSGIWTKEVWVLFQLRMFRVNAMWNDCLFVVFYTTFQCDFQTKLVAYSKEIIFYWKFRCNLISISCLDLKNRWKFHSSDKNSTHCENSTPLNIATFESKSHRSHCSRHRCANFAEGEVSPHSDRHDWRQIQTSVSTEPSFDAVETSEFAQLLTFVPKKREKIVWFSCGVAWNEKIVVKTKEILQKFLSSD